MGTPWAGPHLLPGRRGLVAGHPLGTVGGGGTGMVQSATRNTEAQTIGSSMNGTERSPHGPNQNPVPKPPLWAETRREPKGGAHSGRQTGPTTCTETLCIAAVGPRAPPALWEGGGRIVTPRTMCTLQLSSSTPNCEIKCAQGLLNDPGGKAAG